MPPDLVVAVPASGETVYRLVRKDKPEADGFKPRLLLGKGRLPRGPAINHAGLSTFATAEQARSRATKYESWVAKLDLPADAAVHIAKTDGPGHYTVWGDPKVLEKLAVFVDSAGEGA